MALMEITVVPMGTPTPSIGDYIAEIVTVLEQEEWKYKLADMGSLIEGDVEELLRLAARLHQIPFAKGIQRVMTTIAIDDRRDKRVSLGDKVNSVMARVK